MCSCDGTYLCDMETALSIMVCGDGGKVGGDNIPIMDCHGSGRGSWDEMEIKMVSGCCSCDFFSDVECDCCVLCACPLGVEFAEWLCDGILWVAWLIPGSLPVRLRVPSEEVFSVIFILVWFSCWAASVCGVLGVHMSCSSVREVFNDGGSFLILEIS